MSDLMSTVITGRIVKPWTVVLYGVEGVGKTSAGASAPNPIFISAEGGSDQLDVARFPQAFTFGEINQQLNSIYSDDHNFQTLVIDSADWVQDLIVKDVCKSKNVETIADIPYGKGWAEVGERFLNFLKDLSAIKQHRNMNVLILAHSEIRKFADPTGDPFDFYAVACNEKNITPKLKQWCDCLFFAEFDKTTKEVGEGFNKRTIAKSWGERIIHTEHRASYDAKNRYNLPERLPLPKAAPLQPFLDGYNAFYGVSNNG
ncbi:MAG: ATP-binding protein [Planctomycetaceae bacterium]|nr:ATP-binding protein [Planctomycetaceae bacterium]